MPSIITSAAPTASARSRDLRVRRARFAFSPDRSAIWHPDLPELAIGANSVSLLMPHVEPYVVRSVRAALDDLDPELRARTEDYLRQEMQHQGQHRRFNTVMADRYRWVTGLERVMGRTFAWLSARGSARFNLAFAAGFEAVAYAGARWTDDHLTELFRGAEPAAASLFLWHLAEEVEHKSVAFDVYRASGGPRRTYVAAMVASALVLAVFSFVGTLRMLVSEGRILNPLAHLRLLRWTFSYTFELLPAMAVSALPSHHPDDLADPQWLTTWLATWDEETGTMPDWSLDFLR